MYLTVGLFIVQISILILTKKRDRIFYAYKANFNWHSNSISFSLKFF